MGAEESTLSCCSRSRGHSSRYDTVRDDGDTSARSGKRTPGHFDPVEEVSIYESTREGYLSKTSTLRGGAPRYFRIKEDLYYFGTKDDMSPKGVIMLNRTEALPICSKSAVIGGDRTFQIEYVAGCFLRVPELVDVQIWKDKFNEAIDWPTDPLDEGLPSPPGRGDGEDEQTLPELHSGMLLKKAYGDDWKPYHFVLRKGIAEFYHSISDHHPKGFIVLKNNNMTAQINYVKHQPDVLRLTHSKTLYATAETKEEMEMWVKTINHCIESHPYAQNVIKRPPVGWKRSGKVREAITPLADLLRDPFRVEYFRLFMKEMKCEHYLMFYFDIQQFKRLSKKEDKYYLKPCSLVIYKKYIEEGSTMEIDMPADVKHKTLMAIEDPSASTFKAAQAFILRVLRDEYYTHFLTSRFCVDMAANLCSQSALPTTPKPAGIA